MDRTCETFRPTEIEEGPEAFFIVLPPDPTPTLRVVDRISMPAHPYPTPSYQRM